jgi:hypothetical protein
MADIPLMQPKPNLRIRLPPIQPDHEILASPVATPMAPMAPRSALPPLQGFFKRWIREKL